MSAAGPGSWFHIASVVVLLVPLAFLLHGDYSMRRQGADF